MKWQSTNEASKISTARVLVVGNGCADISIVLQSGSALNWYTPTIVHTLEAAVEALREKRFDAIASHVSAHHSDGLALPSLVSELNRLGALRKIPAVLWCSQLASTVVETHARLAQESSVPVKVVPSLNSSAAHDFVRFVTQGKGGKTPCPSHPSLNSALNAQELARALRSENDIRVVLQPQVDLESGRIVGAEALARWRHRELGDISPSIFVPMANKAGLNALLFSCVGTQVVTLLRQLKRSGIAVPIAVNASADTLCTTNFAALVERRLERAGVQSSLFKIELTEDVAASDMLSLSTTISWLRLRGFQVAIDDFGCGAATLEMLTKLPFSELKIDGHFVREMSNNPRCSAAVDTVLSLARTLSLKVVAEGVETAKLGHLLRLRGCLTGQGFGLFPPLEIHDFVHTLYTNRARRPIAATNNNYRLI